MLESGQMLAHYRLVEKLGQGGMGVVWKATDTKLDRDVAIKFLPEQFAADPERLGRFEREAKLLASLNHRNIASIYGHEEAHGMRFLVMELVEGEDLAERLTRGPLPVDEALDICHQLARALENAHDKGVLHRDLKPANVRISHDGRVKVLDFGLAKAFDTEPLTEGNPTMSPTLTSVETRAGIILGTAAYMSPEQARGKPLDKRTDIWAFGCLLYECLTGRSAFRGETVTDTLASIVKTPADYALLPAETPARVRELMQRCLEKDVRNRLRDIGEARIELQRAIGGTDSTSDANLSVAVPVPTLPRRFSTGWLAAAALMGAAAGIGIWAALSGGPASAPREAGRTVRFSAVFPPDLEVQYWNLSPDGRTIAYVGRPKSGTGQNDDRVPRLYLRAMNSLEARPVESSDWVSFFAFSPDGRWLATLAPVAPRSTKRRLWKLSVDGDSPPLALLDWREGWNPPFRWLPDGDIVVHGAGDESIVRIPSQGGEPREPLAIRTEGYEGAFRLAHGPQAVFPDGVHVLGAAVTYTERGFDDNVAVLNLATGQSRILIENGSSPALSPTGHLVFSRGDTLLATAFDQQTMEPTGSTVAVQAGFRALAGYGDTEFALSGDGTLLHWPGGIYGNKRQLAFVEPGGAAGYRIAEPWSDELRFYEGGLAVSFDQRRLAVGIANDAGLYEIWISDMDRPRLSRFVHEPGRDCEPNIWTRDGEALIYACGTTEEQGLFFRRIDSTEEPRKLLTYRPPDGYGATALLPDGSAVILRHFREGKSNLVLLPLDAGANEPDPGRPWLPDANAATISADGRWLAYSSNVSGRQEVYIRPLGDRGTLGREIPVSTNGGSLGLWEDRVSPPRLTFHSGDEFWSVEVHSAERISAPKSLGSVADITRKTLMHSHLRDGRWLVALKGEGEELPDRVNVVLNWTAELEQRLAAQ